MDDEWMQKQHRKRRPKLVLGFFPRLGPAEASGSGSTLFPDKTVFLVFVRVCVAR